MKEKFNFKSEEINFSNPSEARLFFLLRLLIKKNLLQKKIGQKFIQIKLNLKKIKITTINL